jgi:hypothetical protein
MNDIIKKRTDLINFFFNQEETYTKEDILNKEFSVLSFSPSEEYIDTLHSQFDDLCIDLSTHKIEDTSEIYIKGIIVDVDRQNYQTIIHLQNKESLISVTCKDAVASKYDDCFVTGEPVIVKCKVFNERLYLSLLIQLNYIGNFAKECEYIDGSAKDTIDTIMFNREHEKTHYGLIIECAMVKTSKGRDMLIGTLYDGKQNRSFGIVKTKYNPILPKHAMAGDYVKFNKPTDKFFLNNMEVVNL